MIPRPNCFSAARMLSILDYLESATCRDPQSEMPLGPARGGTKIVRDGVVWNGAQEVVLCYLV
jgi:hypothetical protein